MLLTVILLISTLLVGYLWGKHDGRVEGYQRGVVDLPLLLREQSLEQGYCLLCREVKLPLIEAEVLELDKQIEKKSSDD